jgi:NADPH2:quinone reductase
MMRAMRVHALGEALRLDEVAAPEPGPGEVRLRVRACGLNFADTLMAAGKYQEKPALPFAPGLEVCGVVDALGPGAEGLAVGDRVASYVGGGGLADYVCVAAARCLPAPAGMPDAEVAGFPVAYGTSDVALSWRAKLRPGETLLVTGAAGGVGLTAVEIGKLIGATVIASARGEAKRAAARAAGADHVIDAAEDLRAAVKALGGADVVYDTLGGPTLDACLRAANPEARILPIGFASGEPSLIPANLVLVKNLTVMGLYWGSYATLRPSVLTESFARLFAWHAEGRLRPHVSHELSLAAANEGLDLLRARAATGKVVIRVATE